MKTLVQGWNFMRILRLVLGIAILVQGIVSNDTMTIVLGVILSGLSIANVGCCANGCAVNTRLDNDTKNKL